MSGAEPGVAVESADGVLTLRLSRVHKRNALDHASQVLLVQALEAASTDDALRVIHLTADGPDFCSGSDWVAANKDPGVKPRAGGLVRRLPVQSHRIVELLMTVQLPVVATVRGTAAGMGCQLALAADFAVAEDTATFWEPFVRRGFTPDTGATWLLPRLAGLARARRMLMLGERVTGAQAAEWGLIHDAVPADQLDATVQELLATLAGGPTVALGLTKQLLLRSADASLPRALADESYALELAARTSDFREGLAAFTSRRDPDFEGR